MDELLKKIALNVADLGKDNIPSVRKRLATQTLDLLEDVLPTIEEYIHDYVRRIKEDAEKEVTSLKEEDDKKENASTL